MNIRYDLIDKELNTFNDLEWHKCSITNRLISKLWHHYYLVEMCEKFYDSNHYEKDEDYDEDKPFDIEFNNWIDPISKGIWGFSQSKCDKIARRELKGIQRKSILKKDRIYIAEKDDMILIYYYGRDVWEWHDLWFIYKRKE